MTALILQRLDNPLISDAMCKQKQGLNLDIYPVAQLSDMALPFADKGIQAGFPSPAQDFIESSIDLNREIVTHPAATFYGRVSGDSMIGENIEDGDLLVIDRSIDPLDGDLAVCCLDGDFTLKRIRLETDRVWLIPANESFDPILVTPDRSIEIWGVVTYTIKRIRRERHTRNH